MLNLIVPFETRIIETTFTKENIISNFNTNVEDNMFILTCSENEKDFYGCLTENRLIIKKKAYFRQFFPALHCKIKKSEDGYVLKASIGYKLYEILLIVIFLLFLFFQGHLYICLFLIIFFIISLFATFNESKNKFWSVLEDITASPIPAYHQFAPIPNFFICN